MQLLFLADNYENLLANALKVYTSFVDFCYKVEKISWILLISVKKRKSRQIIAGESNNSFLERKTWLGVVVSDHYINIFLVSSYHHDGLRFRLFSQNLCDYFEDVQTFDFWLIVYLD